MYVGLDVERVVWVSESRSLCVTEFAINFGGNLYVWTGATWEFWRGLSVMNVRARREERKRVNSVRTEV